MDVEYPPRVMVHEPGAEDAHEAGEDQQLRPDLVEPRGNGAIEGFAVGEIAVLDARGGYARGPGTLQAEGIGPVAEDEAEVEIDVAGRGCIDERLQVST